MGCKTLLATMNLDSIAQMSCNPAIGGLAKGHLVREIDALGGVMGQLADISGLQFRMLNTKKGPAVWAPRAQCDKKAYQSHAKWLCERQPNLDLIQAQAARLVHDGGGVQGIETVLGVRYLSQTVIVTTGTFLRGLMHIGMTQSPGGRLGDASAMHLSASLKEVGLALGRLKTGTPPRVLKRTIDFTRLQSQPGDEPPPFFSFWRDGLFHVEPNQDPATPVPRGTNPARSVLEQINGQMCCHLTSTTAATARVVKENLHESPLYSGIIEGVGPRYCPSIEDKIVRFSEKEQHQLFLEPEGIATDEYYINGFSTSLPFEVQVELVRTIIGCERAEIVRPAYAVEYDFAFPTQLSASLETKAVRNLFLAGQINGTSGYEEAAAQGLMAGMNAALRVKGEKPLILRRDQAYIGVLIDDLVTKGTNEPYRMFTSRAEYRLILRQDNADLRLSEIGHKNGLLSGVRYQQVVRKQDAIEAELRRLASNRFEGETLQQLLRRPEITYKTLPGRQTDLDAETAQQVEIMVKYEGYISRQEQDIARKQSLESLPIPSDFDFDCVPSMRIEARAKLKAIRPTTVAQASRISGVSPSDISILTVWLRRRSTGVSANSSVHCDSCDGQPQDDAQPT